MFTDTHCHIYKEYYDDIDSVLDRSKKCNVDRWINNGCDTKTNKEVIKLSDNISSMYSAIGIHPENVLDYKNEDIDFIRNNLNNPKVIAIGEIGLDYHYSKDNKEKQIELFEIQLKIAEENNIPVIIHSREATLDTLNTIKKYNVKGVIHSFSGSLETAKEYIKLGFLLGINGVITFKNSNIKDVYKEIPLENIIIETDSPYLTPEPYRGHTNEPKYIYDIATFVSNLKEVSMDYLIQITNDNIKKMFGI